MKATQENKFQNHTSGSGLQKVSGKIYPNLSIENKSKTKNSKLAGDNPSGKDNSPAFNSKIKSKKITKESSKADASNSWAANGKTNDSGFGK